MSIVQIALTGGPGGGKTEALRSIQSRYQEKGWLVVCIPETATDLILSGLDGRETLPNVSFQQAQLRLQRFKEDLYRQNAQDNGNPNILIICDRGLLDGAAFIDPKQFYPLLDQEGLSPEDVLKRYDAIFHMTTAAKGNGKGYTLSNNPARAETPDQAAEEDDHLLRIYQDHPNHFIIDPASSLPLKMEQLFAQLDPFLNERFQTPTTEKAADCQND